MGDRIYVNGNARVIISDNGTKIRYTPDNEFRPAFPESCDVKICNRCDMGCPQCHEKSVPDGELGNLNHPILDTIHPYTELAIGGGNPLEHPDLYPFLQRMQNQNVICNLTVNLTHFRRRFNELLSLHTGGLIHGLGISVQRLTDDHDVYYIMGFPDAVVHVIAGMIDTDTIDALAHHGLNLLVLGYKTVGRGKDYYTEHDKVIEKKIDMLRMKLLEYKDKNAFRTICFDNLAIEQLDVKSMLSPEEWEQLYMGDDGQFTMYIDLVENKYAISSTKERHPIPDGATIDDVFKLVQEEVQ